MKRAISLILSVVLLLGLSACGSPKTAQSEPAVTGTLVDDSAYVYQPGAEDPATPQGNGTLIAFAADSSGVESGPNAGAWRGVETFAENYGFTAQNFVAEDASYEATLAALRQAAESGAPLVVCRGETMGAALYEVQNNYPTVSYLLLESEPHSVDYVSYSTAANVHCILFQEEQAGYLAGYATVMEGFTSVGFLGGEQLPGNVRYCTGFLQGVDQAAEVQGTDVYVRIWFCNRSEPGEEITEKVMNWFANGAGMVFTCGELVQSSVDASGGSNCIISAGWDASGLSDAILSSAVLNRSAIVQKALYSFFSGGHEAWGAENAGVTTQVGYSDDAVALATADWRFHRFSQAEYERVYEQLRSSTLKVERYSDTSSLPELPNVVLDIQ